MDTKTSFVSCACKKCFFGNMNKSNGIEHKPISIKESKRKHYENICSIEGVDLVEGYSYCRPCCRKWSAINENNC